MRRLRREVSTQLLDAIASNSHAVVDEAGEAAATAAAAAALRDALAPPELARFRDVAMGGGGGTGGSGGSGSPLVALTKAKIADEEAAAGSLEAAIAERQTTLAAKELAQKRLRKQLDALTTDLEAVRDELSGRQREIEAAQSGKAADPALRDLTRRRDALSAVRAACAAAAGSCVLV